uniref:DNA-directed RNA polymerase II subunit RPB7 n=1 Tax=Lygus hesperus TaxID=30085 RepID=A0A0A9YU34_LYGHE
MFYLVPRVEKLILKPRFLNADLERNIEIELRAKIEGKYSNEWGYSIAIYKIESLGKGLININDASAAYTINFYCLQFVPVIGEILMCVVKNIDEFVIAMCGPLEFVIALNNIGENASDYKCEIDQGEKRFVSMHDEIRIGSKVLVKVLNISSTHDAVLGVGKLLRSVDARI